jgi:hypothetical protein
MLSLPPIRAVFRYLHLYLMLLKIARKQFTKVWAQWTCYRPPLCFLKMQLSSSCLNLKISRREQTCSGLSARWARFIQWWSFLKKPVDRFRYFCRSVPWSTRGRTR